MHRLYSRKRSNMLGGSNAIRAPNATDTAVIVKPIEDKAAVRAERKLLNSSENTNIVVYVNRYVCNIDEKKYNNMLMNAMIDN